MAEREEMMPHRAGERVFLADLKVGDVLDVWSKRSGGYFVAENVTIADVIDGEAYATGGLILKADAGWGELRRKSKGPAGVQPLWLLLTHQIRHRVWADWETMPDCCPGCTAEWVRSVVEPILREALEGKHE